MREVWKKSTANSKNIAREGGDAEKLIFAAQNLNEKRFETYKV